MQDVEQLAFIFMDAFDLAVEERIWIDALRARRIQPVGEAGLGGALGLLEVGDKRRVVGQREEVTELGQVRDPAVANGLGDQTSEVGVRQEEPATWRDAIGFIIEPLGKQVGEILHHRRAQQPGVDLGHAISAVAPNNRQVGHAHLLHGCFLDQARAHDARLVLREARPHVVQEAAIDLIDDLEVSGETNLEEMDWPLFQGLGQQGVIGVCQRPRGQIPGLVPAEPGLIQQEAHQLGHGQRRMRVIELDRHLLWQGVPVIAPTAEARHDIGQRARHQKILLGKPQGAPAVDGIIRIEHAGQRFCGDLVMHRPNKVAAAELAKVELVRRAGLPQPERVDGLATVPDHGPIKRDAQQHHGWFAMSVSTPFPGAPWPA